MTDPADPAVDTDMTAGTDTPCVVLLTGAGVHADPWHALAATTGRLAGLLHDEGYTDIRTVGTEEPQVFADAVVRADVLVINVSGDLSCDAPDSTALVDVVLAHASRGAGIVASHSSTLAFRDDPRWAALLGGRWVPGTSLHPQIGRSLVQACPHTLDGLAFSDFVVYDERYTFLEISEDVEVLAVHTEDGVRHPLIWVAEAREGWGRIAYDALGHGVESYDSPDHRRLFLSLVSWAAGTGQQGQP